jgi:cytoskeletal protein CcmA (bactofilin family)
MQGQCLNCLIGYAKTLSGMPLAMSRTSFTQPKGNDMLNRDGLFTRRDLKADEPGRKDHALVPPAGSVAATPAQAPAAARPAPATDLRAPAQASSTDARPISMGEGSKLIVGPNIQLKGVEISNCDVLSVEGHVEATVSSKALHIAQPGTFNGQADIEIAEIQGTFTGDLTVRKKLVIQATGKVSGKIRYGKLVIEEGGELSGDVKTTEATPATGASASGSGVASSGSPRPSQSSLSH